MITLVSPGLTATCDSLLKTHFPSAWGAHVSTETICKAAQKKQVKTDGDRMLQLTRIDLLLERGRETEGGVERGF